MIFYQNEYRFMVYSMRVYQGEHKYHYLDKNASTKNPNCWTPFKSRAMQYESYQIAKSSALKVHGSVAVFIDENKL